MFRPVAGILALFFCAACLPSRGQDKAPPKELVQYVQDAQKAGLNSAQIQQNAVGSGWPVALVNEAIASARPGDKEKTADDSAGKNTETAKQPAQAEPQAQTKDSVAERPSGAAAAPAAVRGETPQPAAVDMHQPENAGSIPPAINAKPPEPSVSKQVDRNVATPDDYEIGAGDVLKITVWREPDASLASAVVLPNGRVSLPLLHDVEVAGMTVPQLEKALTERLSNLINTPEVSVVVTAMNSKKIYLMGKVKKEGTLPYNYRMTVLQALTEAGGVTDYAKKKDIYVLRTENGRQFKLPFDYRAVLKGEHLETNIQLIPGDTIIVP